MKLLAIDTATEACSAALWLNGEVSERYRVAPRQHAELILPMIDELLQESGLELVELDALAFGRGPGAFTGLRIGAGLIQGLAFGAELKVVPVSNLAALAQRRIRLQGAQRVACAIDARQNEVYWGAYAVDADNVARMSGEEAVLPARSVPQLTGGPWHGVGSGWAAYRDELALRVSQLTEIDIQALPHAEDIVRLAMVYLAADPGSAVDAEQALPIYLRNEVAVKPD